jgi:hypothetical protein
MRQKNKGLHIRRMNSAQQSELVGPGGLIPSDSLRAETVRIETPRSFRYPDQPLLGVVLPGSAGKLVWDSGEANLQAWSFIYIPRDLPFELENLENRPLSVVLFMPVRADEARWEASSEGEPVIVKLEEMWIVEKEGRICYNAAGQGFPIDKPYFMGSFCVYDLKYGEMPQHVHEDQEEFMIILRSKGTRSGFDIEDHSHELDDWTLIHAFEGAWHGFVPAEDGLITIFGLYLNAVPGGCTNAFPISEKELNYWQSTCEDLPIFAQID